MLSPVPGQEREFLVSRFFSDMKSFRGLVRSKLINMGQGFPSVSEVQVRCQLNQVMRGRSWFPDCSLAFGNLRRLVTRQSISGPGTSLHE